MQKEFFGEEGARDPSIEGPYGTGLYGSARQFFAPERAFEIVDTAMDLGIR